MTGGRATGQQAEDSSSKDLVTTELFRKTYTLLSRDFGCALAAFNMALCVIAKNPKRQSKFTCPLTLELTDTCIHLRPLLKKAHVRQCAPQDGVDPNASVVAASHQAVALTHHVFALPLSRRPLMPGIVMSVPVECDKIIKELTEQLKPPG
eukprot:912427-Prorocentrum_minimum.AAC.6